MKALIVAESWFGNATAIAEHIAEGLGALNVSATVTDITEATDHVTAEYDLLIIGAPTHNGELSTADSRKAVTDSGGPEGHTGVREWIERVDIADGVKVTSFTTLLDDTNPDKTAANAIAKRLSERFPGKVIEVKTFLVEESKGPLAYGEDEAAKDWGKDLADSLR